MYWTPTRFWWRVLISCQQCVQRQRRDGAYLCVVGGGVLAFAEYFPVPGCAASSADGSRAHTFLRIGCTVFKCHNFSSYAFHQMGEDGFGTVNLKVHKLFTCLYLKHNINWHTCFVKQPQQMLTFLQMSLFLNVLVCSTIYYIMLY